MHLLWNIIGILWLEILSLETHDAMKCVYRKINFHNLHERSNEDLGKIYKYSFQSEEEVLDTRNVLDCQCSAKTKVRELYDRIL